MRFKWFASVVPMFFVCIAVHAQTPDTTLPSYESLLAEVRAGNTDIDFGALRMAFTRTDAYDPYGSVAVKLRKKSMYQDMENEAYADARAGADTVLAQQFVDIDAHLIAMVAARKLDDSVGYAFHRAVALGLLSSIEASGRGLDPDSPFVIISVNEEYALMRMRGLEFTEQSLVQCASGFCDKMTANDEEGNVGTLYFDISIPMGTLGKASTNRQGR